MAFSDSYLILYLNHGGWTLEILLAVVAVGAAVLVYRKRVKIKHWAEKHLPSFYGDKHDD